MSVVYFVQIGRAVKIGFTAISVESRVAAFRTGTAENIEILATVPGDRKLEKRFHRLFEDDHICGELFRPTDRLGAFLTRLEVDPLERSIRYLEATTRAACVARSLQKTEIRYLQKRRYERAKDAVFVAAVSERKARVGF